MNQLATLARVAGVVAGLALTSSQAILIDDFNNYVNSSYIQTQNPAWSRFGAGTTDGISSIAGGVGGTRGAAYSANFANGFGSVKYTFSSLQNYTSTFVLTLDLAIPLSLAGTQVQAVIYDGNLSDQTIYQTTAQSLTNATYITYTFEFTPATVTRTQGAASLADVLANVGAIGFRFSNTNGTGSATINFDNLNVVPEPSTVATLGLAGVIVGLYRLRCRQRGCNVANIH